MRELAAHLLRWHAANTVYVLATVVRVTGSAPRPAGATMGVGGSGNVRGSLSGGCGEGAVDELWLEVLASGR
ncbi:XdhC family protein, partial [Nocardia abscessus]|uniref:XdhC family protein n=1 Tax=Nocardia abscessus TaxID=120957 RepID=UPI002455529D